MILKAEHVSITFYASFNPIIKRWNVDTSTTCIDYHMLLFFTSGSFFTISLWILDLPILYLRPADLETEAQILCGLESIPLKINMEPKNEGLKRLFSFIFLFKQVIFRFHVNFPGCGRFLLADF